jgi:hypothetical protein
MTNPRYWHEGIFLEIVLRSTVIVSSSPLPAPERLSPECFAQPATCAATAATAAT